MGWIRWLARISDILPCHHPGQILLSRLPGSSHCSLSALTLRPCACNYYYPVMISAALFRRTELLLGGEAMDSITRNTLYI